MDIGPESAERPTTAVNSELAGDLLCKKTNRDFFEVDNVEKLNIFYEYEFGISDINVKGRLKKTVEFWEQIGTSKFISDVMKEGYKIMLLHKPEKTFLKNNKSSIDNKHFVDTHRVPRHIWGHGFVNVGDTDLKRRFQVSWSEIINHSIITII
jgi:hypothetical protein